MEQHLTSIDGWPKRQEAGDTDSTDTDSENTQRPQLRLVQANELSDFDSAADSTQATDTEPSYADPKRKGAFCVNVTMTGWPPDELGNPLDWPDLF